MPIVSSNVREAEPGGGPGIKEIYINGQFIPIQYPGLGDDPGVLLANVTLTDTLPAVLQYQRDVWTATGGPAEADGVITFTTRVNLPGMAAVPITNTALVNDGLGNPRACQVTVIANGQAIFLPLVVRTNSK